MMDATRVRVQSGRSEARFEYQRPDGSEVPRVCLGCTVCCRHVCRDCFKADKCRVAMLGGQKLNMDEGEQAPAPAPDKVYAEEVTSEEAGEEEGSSEEASEL